MSQRAVRYVPHEPADPAMRALFVTLECVPDGWIHHAVTVPRAWTPIATLPIDPDPGAPILGSLVVESPALDAKSAIIACGGVPRGFAGDAKGVITALAARDRMAPYRWNDEDDAVGGARAMITDKVRIGGVRVLPLGDGRDPDVPGWVYYACVGPQDRLGEFAGALKHGLASFKVHPFAKWGG